VDEDQRPVRSLSKREAELIGWLEAERRRSVRAAEVRSTLGWSDSTASNVLSRLTKKGWLRQTAKGRYETLLAETGGWSVPNAWAALSTWKQRYYVGLKSAAYELQLTPDRPGTVQVCVPVGAKRPVAWHDVPIVLVFMRTFDDLGVGSEQLHGFPVRMASVEKVLVDGATGLGRMGGLLGFARVVERSIGRANWQKVVTLAEKRGNVGLRRIAALLDALGRQIPEPLALAATARSGDSAIFLGDRKTYGSRGERLPRWQVVVNVDRDVIREEIMR
jgi:predicted transcriptional regulator of viral defense system